MAIDDRSAKAALFLPPRQPVQRQGGEAGDELEFRQSPAIAAGSQIGGNGFGGEVRQFAVRA